MQDIIDFYSEHSDHQRLAGGWGLLEFARTQEIVRRHLPAGRRTILDVGGGTGGYAEWLGELGHEVHLVDVTPEHIAAARVHRTHIASAEIGDARHLSWPDASADAALLFGPLYHLVEAGDRTQALHETRRVLRPGGLIFAAGICRFAPLLGSLVEAFFDDPAFRHVLARDLRDGQHRNTTGDPRRFTTAYFHRPEELHAEISDTGFDVVDLLPVEGPCWLAAGSADGFAKCWSNPSRRDELLHLARTVEHDPMSLAVTQHLLAIGRA
jgi:ubiquinone/menaquinone biosynthesis C-methylase UbiE